MANFKKAYKLTMVYEGGYANDSDDVGGETYKGVARRYYPNWEGWVIIDQYKNYPDFPAILDTLEDLQTCIFEFFKTNYWDVIWGDSLPNQEIANEMFDIAVNMGVSRATKFIQAGLNILNRNQKNYPDIVEDGKFGPKTFSTLQYYLSIDSPKYLRKIIVIFRGMHYIEYMRKNSPQEKFARGWLNRTNF